MSETPSLNERKIFTKGKNCVLDLIDPGNERNGKKESACCFHPKAISGFDITSASQPLPPEPLLTGLRLDCPSSQRSPSFLLMRPHGLHRKPQRAQWPSQACWPLPPDEEKCRHPPVCPPSVQPQGDCLSDSCHSHLQKDAKARYRWNDQAWKLLAPEATRFSGHLG